MNTQWRLFAVFLLLISSACAHRVTFRKDPLPTRTVAERIHFPFGKKMVSFDDQKVLEEIAELMDQDKNSVAILEGHADPIGANSSNEILSEERARDIRVRLRDLGVEASRLTIISKGEQDPLVLSRNREGNAPNRRVEIQVTLTDSK